MMAVQSSPSFTEDSPLQGETWSETEVQVNKEDRESIFFLFFKIHPSPLPLHFSIAPVCACETGVKLGNLCLVNISLISEVSCTNIKIHSPIKIHLWPSARCRSLESARIVGRLVAWVLPTIPIGIGIRETSRPFLKFLSGPPHVAVHRCRASSTRKPTEVTHV
jgi:hypothetical protein